jgi:thioredoxin-related protein
MKTLLLSMLVLAMPVVELEQISIGDSAPKTDLKMENLNGEKVSLDDLKMENGLCVIFSCNTCPYVLAWEDRYNELEGICRANKVGFVLVNSNEAKRNGADSMEEMKIHAKDKGYGDYAYVVDTNHELADAFGATKTPDVFLFNGDMNLTYKGAIDDNKKDRHMVLKPYLKKAIDAMAKGQKINPETTKAIGCTIKRVS